MKERREKRYVKTSCEMYYQDLGYETYQDFLANNPHWRKIREKRIRANKKCKKRWCGAKAKLTHHLTYKHLGSERRGETVDICFDSNYQAHFYDDGSPVPLDEVSLRARWKEINSLWWNFKRLRPSDVLGFIFRL